MANRKSAPTPMQKQFAETLEEQRFEMFLHVARELTGRAKQRQLQKGKALDWEAFNTWSGLTQLAQGEEASSATLH